MTRDTRMLLTIVAGAALAGWVIVRLVSPAPETAVPPMVVSEAPIAEQPPVPTTKPAPAPAPEKSAGIREDESAAIVRQLDVLVRAVRKDKHLRNVAFPESTRILDIPSLTPYVRAVEFWQPAFSTKERR